MCYFDTHLYNVRAKVILPQTWTVCAQHNLSKPRKTLKKLERVRSSCLLYINDQKFLTLIVSNWQILGSAGSNPKHIEIEFRKVNSRSEKGRPQQMSLNPLRKYLDLAFQE